MPRLLIVFLTLLSVLAVNQANAGPAIPQNRAECIAVCDQYFPAGPVVPPATSKPYSGKVIFDNTSDKGPAVGTACVLIAPGMSQGSLNGDAAIKGNQHNGLDVWYFPKSGDKYSRPLSFIFTHPSGQRYSFVVNPTVPPTGDRTETVAPSSYGNPDGEGRKRGNARFSHPGSYYGKNIEVWIDGVLKMKVANGGKRQEGENGLVFKPVSDSNRKLVVVGPYGLKFSKCTIKF